MGKLSTIMRRGRHYGIERFGASVGLLVVALVVFVAAATGYTVRTNAERDAVTSVYTSSFTTSGAGVSGSVRGVYTNADQTRAAMLVQLSDMTNLSIDASKYSVELAGVDGFGYLEGVKSRPACGLFVYGNTGYMVFYMQSRNKIPAQRLALNVDMGLTMGGASDDSGLVDRDSWSVQFNPGARDIMVLDALDGKTFDPVRFYNETVVAESEAEARKVLVKDIKNMRTELTAIAEYRDRVAADGIVLDNMTPEWVVGDSMKISDGDTITYDANTVMPGGLELDWTGGSVEKGFIKDAMAQTGYSDVDEFMNALKPVAVPSALGLDWRFSDGSSLDELLASSPNNARYKKADTDTTALEAAWSTYASTKAKYQGEHLYRLLEIEYESRDIADVYTSVTTDDGAIKVYS